MTRSPADLQLVETADGSRTYFNPAFNETYHSIHGALTESLTVFIRGSRFARYLSTTQITSSGDTRRQNQYTLIEVGFGLGLNFLLTADLALTHGVTLNYHAVENALPTATQLALLDYRRHLRNPTLCDRLLEGVDALENESIRTADPTQHHCKRLIITAEIALNLHTELEALHRLEPESADVLFLDGFSPDSNPACWTNAMLTRYFELLVAGGVLVTYSAKGRLRRQLQATGFNVQKCPGPPGKREFVRAVKPA